jgi:sulfane dehydrogenase subunit SoxC
MAPADDVLKSISEPSRVALDNEGIGLDELGLASRNHGLFLESMRHDITPLGMHYLLTHYDVPDVDPQTWRLSVDGLVDRPMIIDLTELRRRPQVSMAVTLECAGNGRARMLPRPVSQPWLNEAVGTMRYTGTPLRPILEDAGIGDATAGVVFTALDHGVERGVEQDYARGLPLSEALSDDVLLVYEANGQALLPQHGFPVRLVVPGWYGMAHVKWLSRIELIDHEFDGYQQIAYRLRADADDPGEPLTRIEPRALVIPPGWPDFLSRRRFMPPGRVELQGRAWSGWGRVSQVDVTVDGGQTWRTAELHDSDGPWAWRRWTLPWDAKDGRYTLAARATDETGRSQARPGWPARPEWNRGGFANPESQLVDVLVTDRQTR